MNHLTCPKCGSNDHTTGYGLAAGPMGGYTFCNGCDELIEIFPDLDGLEEDHAARITASAEKHLRAVWGDKYKESP